MGKLDRESLKNKALGSLMGVVIGDAMGLPVECKSPNEIRQRFGYVDDYVPNRYHAYSNVAKRAAGSISDDSQLTLALMDSLRRRAGYDLSDIRRAHVEAFDGKWGPRVGWGGTTKTAVQQMKQGHSQTTVPDGAGNGTCMKIAPLAIYAVYKTLCTPHGKFTNSFNHSLLKKCREVTLLTHGDPGCIVATYCQSRMIIRAMQDEIPVFSKQIAAAFMADAVYAEKKFGITGPQLLSDRLSQVLEIKTTLGKNEPVSAFDLVTGKISVMICSSGSSWVYNSYPLVAYCASKYLPYNNFRYALSETVNAGADADSNASMVGAIFGARVGLSEIPTEMIKGVRKWREILRAARGFEQSL